MAIEHVEQALAAILSPEDMAAIKAWAPTDAEKEFKMDPYTGKAATIYETKFLNDPAFLEKIPEDKIPQATLKKVEAGQYGRFMNETKAFWLSKGVKEEQIKDALESKSLKKLNELATDIYGKTFGSPDEALKKLQTDYNALALEKENLTTAQAKAVEDATNNLKGTYEGRIENLLAGRIIHGLSNFKEGEGDKAKEFEFIVDAMTVAPLLHQNVKAKYSITLDANDKFVLKQKAHPALDEMVGSKALTYEQAILQAAKDAKFVAEKVDPNKKKEKEKTTITIDGTEKGGVASYIKKAAGVE